jgi:hypothetical protein
METPSTPPLLPLPFSRLEHQVLCRGQVQELVRVRLLHPPHAATSQWRRATSDRTAAIRSASCAATV